jgi:hypothetical protein
MRFSTSYKANKALRSIGRKALLKFDFKKPINHWLQDQYLVRIVKACFKVNESLTACKKLYTKIHGSRNGLHSDLRDYSKVLTELVKLFPNEFLDVFVDSTEYFEHEYKSSFQGNSKSEHPFKTIGLKKMLKWAGNNKVRITRVLSCVSPFEISKSQKLVWKKEVLELLERDYSFVLETLERLVYPTSWSGSRAEILAERCVLFEQLELHPKKSIRIWSLEQLKKLNERIILERKYEIERNRQVAQSFE